MINAMERAEILFRAVNIETLLAVNINIIDHWSKFCWRVDILHIMKILWLF